MIQTSLLLVFLSSISLQIPTALAAESSAKSGVLDLNKGSGAVTFDALGKPSMLKIHGKGDAPQGELKVEKGKLKGTATFKLESLDTGIGMRNKHMKDRYLEIGKYPEAKLTFNDLPLPENYATDGFTAENLPFKGTLSLHGVEKPVEGTAKIARKGDSMSVDALFGIKTSDFNIAAPSFAGVTMAENVNIEVQTTAPFQVH